MILEIKQIGKFGDRDEKSEYGEYTMLPTSSRTYVIKRGIDRRFITGLDKKPEKRKELEKVFAVDLSSTSDFWLNYTMTFEMPEGSMKIDLKDPYKELFYIVATANKLIAPDKETLKSDYDFKKNTIFYVYDKEALERKSQLLQEIKDEVAGKMYTYRNSKEKMLYVAHALGLFVTESFKEESLYSLLSRYREKLITQEQLEAFRSVIDTSNEDLQAAYFTSQGLKTGLIAFDKTVDKYKFQEKHIGRLQSDVVSYFKNKKNEAELSALIMEVKDKLK